jgi:hypothetical protein
VWLTAFEACYLVVYITMMGISVELLILRLSRIGGVGSCINSRIVNATTDDEVHDAM